VALETSYFQTYGHVFRIADVDDTSATDKPAPSNFEVACRTNVHVGERVPVFCLWQVATGSIEADAVDAAVRENGDDDTICQAGRRAWMPKLGTALTRVTPMSYDVH
jgi:hypothetical protein